MTRRQPPPVRRPLAPAPSSGREPYLARALAHQRAGRLDEAERELANLVKLKPDHLAARLQLAGLLMMRREPARAEPQYAAAARIDPRQPLVFYHWGRCLRALGRLGDAITAYRRALVLKPDFIEPAANLASALTEAGALEEAESLYRGLVERRPDLVDLQESLGRLYHLWQRLDQARGQFESLLRVRPDHAGGLLGLAAILVEEHDLSGARRLIESAGASPGVRKADLLVTLAGLQAAEGDYRAAVGTLGQAIQSGANQPHHHLTLARWLARLKEREEAVAVLERSLAQFGERPADLLPALVVNQYAICDWRGAEERLRRLLARLRGPTPPPIPPLAALTLPGLTPTDLQRLTRVDARRLEPFWSRPLPTAPRSPSTGRLRIGYLSFDLHEHATAYLTAAVFEAHDRERYEVFAYSYGPDDGSPTRHRLVAAFEHFVDIRALSHRAAAERIRADGIDILVDLKGYTTEARPEIPAQRPAPIQVNWLGYPGTMAAPFMDYLIVDETVVPPAEAAAYDEALAYLPDAYAPVDPRRPLASPPNREEVGLPSAGFVFCCFNNPRKINPEVFERWCRLLLAVPESVLWLFAGQPAALARLRAEAARRGLAPERLIFAPKVSQPEHLARLALADLVLDTRPYNAHTTASDALWIGVPILTCPGETFASRVAASLLRAAGLPELIVATLDDYEAAALRLARQPAELAALRQRLRAARERAPYFDPVGFARHLEALYQRMWARHDAGLPPALLPPERGEGA